MVVSGGGILSCLPIPCFQLPMSEVGALGSDVPGLRLHLAQAGGHVPGHPGATGSFLSSCIGSFFASHSHMVGYPVQPHPSLLRSKALEATRARGDEAHCVAGVWLL